MIVRMLVSFTAAFIVGLSGTCFALKATLAAKDGGDATLFIQQNVAPRQPIQSPGRLSTNRRHTLAPKGSTIAHASSDRFQFDSRPDLSGDPILTEPLEWSPGDHETTLSKPVPVEDDIENSLELELPASIEEETPPMSHKRNSVPPTSAMFDTGAKGASLEQDLAEMPSAQVLKPHITQRQPNPPDQDPADAMHDWEYWRRFAEHVIREKKGLQSEVQMLRENAKIMQQKNDGLRKNQQDLQQAITELRSRINDEENQWALQLQNAEVQHGQENRDLRDHAKKFQHENAELQAKYTRLATQAKNLQLHLQAVEEDKEDVEGSALKFKEENKRLIQEFHGQQDAAKQALKLEEDMASEIYQLKEAKIKLQAMYADCRSKTLSKHETIIAEAQRSVEEKNSVNEQPTNIVLPLVKPKTPKPVLDDNTTPDIDSQPITAPPSDSVPDATIPGFESLPSNAQTTQAPSDPLPGVMN